jgi:hypothetical protein
MKTCDWCDGSLTADSVSFQLFPIAGNGSNLTFCSEDCYMSWMDEEDEKDFLSENY